MSPSFPWWLLGLIGVGSVLLLMLGVGLVGLVAWQARRKRLPLGDAFSTVASLAWGLPAVAVLVWLVIEASPHLRHLPPSPAAGPVSVAENQANLGSLVAQSAEVDPESERPAWVSAAEVDAGERVLTPVSERRDTELVVVRSLQYATVAEASDDALSAATRLVQKEFRRTHPASAVGGGDWQVPVEFVGRHAVVDRYVEAVERDFGTFTAPMYRTYLRVDLSPETRAELEPLWRSHVATHRLWILGSLLGLVTVMLGTAATYFRLDALTNGHYRGRLRVAATALVVATGLATSLMLHSV